MINFLTEHPHGAMAPFCSCTQTMRDPELLNAIVYEQAMSRNLSCNLPDTKHQKYRISCFKFFSTIVLPIFLYDLKEIKRWKGIYIKPVVSPFELFKEKLINFCPITQ
jgi:hypothetical protein